MHFCRCVPPFPCFINGITSRSQKGRRGSAGSGCCCALPMKYLLWYALLTSSIRSTRRDTKRRSDLAYLLLVRPAVIKSIIVLLTMPIITINGAIVVEGAKAKRVCWWPGRNLVLGHVNNAQDRHGQRIPCTLANTLAIQNSERLTFKIVSC